MINKVRKRTIKQILLLKAIFLNGCINVDVQMDTDSSAVTATETMSIYMDHLNNEQVTFSIIA